MNWKCLAYVIACYVLAFFHNLWVSSQVFVKQFLTQNFLIIWKSNICRVQDGFWLWNCFKFFQIQLRHPDEFDAKVQIESSSKTGIVARKSLLQIRPKSCASLLMVHSSYQLYLTSILTNIQNVEKPNSQLQSRLQTNWGPRTQVFSVQLLQYSMRWTNLPKDLTVH